jgi:hypothetical protein
MVKKRYIQPIVVMKIKSIKRYIIYILIFLLVLGLMLFLWNPFKPVKVIRKINDLQNEKDLIYVSSAGILNSCDVIPQEISSSTKGVSIDYSKIKEGSVVYIHGSAIAEFAKSMDRLQHRIILVSGDCDESIPDMVFESSEDFAKFIDSDKIIHWYSQNAVRDHPKLTKIPIGMDYHTKENALQQETHLIRVKNDSPSLKDRKITCYSNFHFNNPENSKYGHDRRDAISKINKELIFYEPVKIERIESWKNQAEYAFIVSPHGNGLDCHRTWEALILGSIPIVKTSPIDSLFDDLPVLIVDDWSDITDELLQKTVARFSTMQFNYEKLYLSYWVNIIRSTV